MGMLGRVETAESALWEALNLFEDANNTGKDRAACLHHLGTAARELGKPEEAIHFFIEALKLYQNTGILENSEIDCIHALAHTLKLLERYEAALTLFRQLLSLCENSDLPRYVDCLINIAIILHLQHQTEEADQILKQAHDIFTEKIPELHSLGASILDTIASWSTDPAFRRKHLILALQYAVPAAVFFDEFRFKLSCSSARIAWITNRAQHSMNQALDIAARLGDAPLVAELVAKWRMVGSLAAMPAARNSDDPLLTMVPNSTPEPDETLTRTPGPNLVLPHLRATPLYQHPTIADRPRAHYR